MPGPESSVETIQYCEIAMHEIHEVSHEETPRVNFGKLDIRRAYVNPPEGLGFSSTSIATIIDRTPPTVITRLRKQGIEIRPRLKNPAAEERRIGSQRGTWKEHYDELVTRIHTPVADEKRAVRMRQVWAEDSDYSTAALQALGRARQRSTELAKERKEERERRIAGQNILRAGEILEDPRFPSLSPREQEILRYRYRLDGQRTRTFADTGVRFGNVTGERARQIESRALRKLKTLRKRSGLFEANQIKR